MQNDLPLAPVDALDLPLCSQSKPSAVLCSISRRSWFHSNLGNRLQPRIRFCLRETFIYRAKVHHIKNFEDNLVPPVLRILQKIARFLY